MGVDMLEAERSLVYASQVHTTAVVNTTVVPTIPMLAGMMNYPPDAEENIRRHTNSDEYFGGRISEISELYFGSKLFTNIILLGSAFQKGLIPVSEQNLVDAIVETVPASQRARNMEAFRLGRKMVVEPELLEFKNLVADERTLTLFGAKESYQSILDMKAKQLSHSYWMFWRGHKVADEYRRLVMSTVSTMSLDEETNRGIARRIYDLIMWGDLPYAEKYVDKVLEVFRNDREDKGYAATTTAMLDLHKVMAIKDEIYTPHLLTDGEKLDRDKIRYNVDDENGDKITYEHINRPEFEVFGKQVRFDLPQWLAHNWLMRIFKHMKWTRTVLDSWGWHKKERAFRDWYKDDVIGFYLKKASSNYDLALRALRVINDPYRPNEFAVTGFREVIYPKMDKARREFEELAEPGQQLPIMPMITASSEL
jgi:indolepyruvate ferredoxin oxidoreductase